MKFNVFNVLKQPADSGNEVIAVDYTRLVGQYIGQTEENMKTVLEEAKGNVLFIDEAYTVFTGSDDHKDFRRRVLDSLPPFFPSQILTC